MSFERESNYCQYLSTIWDVSAHIHGTRTHCSSSFAKKSRIFCRIGWWLNTVCTVCFSVIASHGNTVYGGLWWDYFMNLNIFEWFCIWTMYSKQKSTHIHYVGLDEKARQNIQRVDFSKPEQTKPKPVCMATAIGWWQKMFFLGPKVRKSCPVGFYLFCHFCADISFIYIHLHAEMQQNKYKYMERYTHTDTTTVSKCISTVPGFLPLQNGLMC